MKCAHVINKKLFIRFIDDFSQLQLTLDACLVVIKTQRVAGEKKHNPIKPKQVRMATFSKKKKRDGIHAFEIYCQEKKKGKERSLQYRELKCCHEGDLRWGDIHDRLRGIKPLIRRGD